MRERESARTCAYVCVRVFMCSEGGGMYQYLIYFKFISGLNLFDENILGVKVTHLMGSDIFIIGRCDDV